METETVKYVEVTLVRGVQMPLLGQVKDCDYRLQSRDYPSLCRH